jgi:pilus assembly protein CpaE
MAQLVGRIVTEDDEFRKHIARMLRSGAMPVGVIDDRVARDATPPDVIIVDARGDSSSAMATIERLRAGANGAGIFAVALQPDPDLILQAMRAGANEYFTWPPADEPFHGAIRRTASRRETVLAQRPSATTLVFFGAKGGAGTTTMAVNTAVELARRTGGGTPAKSTVIVDLKAGLGEVSLFLGVRPRFTVLDAIDNLHRLDREFLKELVVKHKSGLDILSGSEHFDRPGAADSSAIEEMLRLLAKQYDYIAIDAGSQITSCTVTALYSADQMFLIANPDVPSVRNAQRLLERVRQLGALGDRVRVVLNRAAEPFPIPPKQIESALGHPIHQMFPSDYKTVSTALNSGVPLTLAGNSDIAQQFATFTRRVLHPKAVEHEAETTQKRGLLGLEKIASLW